MKYLLFFLIILSGCFNNFRPEIPQDVLAELQSDSTQMFNLSRDVDTYTAKNFEKHTEKLKAGDTTLIYIYSDGGEVDSAEKIIGSMAKFKTICIADKALSAAFEIFQHCTVRIYMDRTLLMAHHHYMVFRSGTIVTAPEMLIDGLSAYIQEASLLGRCATRMQMTLTDLNNKIAKNGGEWYIYGDDIIKNNAADYHIKDSQVTKMTKK